MKRLVLRIAALGTVVVLGLFAIAQAQRGAEDSDENPLRNPAAADPADAEPGRLGELAPEASPLRPSSPPRLVPAGPTDRETASSTSNGNPLRPSERLVSATVEEPAAPTGESRESGEIMLEPDPGQPPLRAPMGLPSEPPPSSPDPSEGYAMVGSADPPDTLQPPPEKATPPPAMEDRFPNLDEALSPPNSGATATRSPMAGNSAGFGPPPTASTAGPPMMASAGQTAAGPTELSQAGEPAPFQMDPVSDGGGIPPASPSTSNLPGAPPADRSPSDVGGLADGNGQPGAKHLEGPQTPQLTIQKTAPAEVQVGKNAVFRVTVRNVGPITASGVEIRDRVPKGTRLIDTTPPASRGPRGELVWSLGTIEPGGETTVEMQVMPTEEGEIGSVATVLFSADASVRTTCTKPELVLRCMAEDMAEDKVLIGELVTLKIELLNPGSGVATGVVISEQVPPGLAHSAGRDLEYEVGTLTPGESRKLELTLEAAEAGRVTNLLTARAEGNLSVEERVELEIVAPQLDLALQGPTRRFLEREAVYELSVHNPGTASAEGVELVAYLPEGLKFISADNRGHYDAAKGAVFWQLAELPVNETGTVQLVTLPIRSGQQKIRLEGSAGKDLRAEEEHPVTIEGIAAISFEVADVNDPVGIGGETTYEIRVVNQGTKAAGNVRLAVDLPPELNPVAAEGPTRNSLAGNRVLFESLAQLAPKADTTYRVRAKALRPGDLRVRVQVLTDDLQSPVVKEESTRVYSDQ